MKPLFTPEEHLEMCRARARLWEIRNKAQPYPLYAAGEEAPLPVAPERLMREVMELKGITYNTRQKVQEHISKKKRKAGRFD
uniref:Uncharacterized protein n=1 Tax=viral metagenome TaxID=1070528 RepID=A0A6M3Y6D6_9ZZZZ